MKKQLLLGALLMGAVCANAQIEKIVVDGTDAGIAADPATVEAGTVVGQSDNVTVKIAYQEAVKASSSANNGFNTVTVDGESIELSSGVTGSSNPKATVTSAATEGMVIQIDVVKNGWITVVGKLSSNKPYYVWEGLANADPGAVAYTLAMDWGLAGIADHPTIKYSLPADADLGYINMEASDISRYVDENGAIRWPEKIEMNDPSFEKKKNGVGVIVFPVWADAGSYLVHATGSKITCSGVFFTPEKPKTITISGADEETQEPKYLTLIGEGGETGVNGIQAEKAEVEGQTYDLGGRPATKGLLIQKGKAKRFVK